MSTFGDKTWVLLVEMERKVESTRTCFLRQITGKRARMLPHLIWETPRDEAVQEVAGTQLEMAHIGRR